MGKKYLEIKEKSLESSVYNILHGIQEEKEVVDETNKNDKSDDGDGMDAVQPKAVKKKFASRKDKDIDNDGDVDSSDKYLHKRRKAVSKAITKKEGNAFGKALKDAKDKGEKTFVVSGKTYEVKEENYKTNEAYKPIKSNHYDVKIQGVKKKDVNAILKYIKVDGGNYDIEDIDADQVTGGGMSGTSDGDIFIQGDDAGKLGMEIAKKFRNVKVMGEGLEADLDEGKMSQMHQMIKDKKTPAQIAKAMGLDLKTVKSLMDGYNKMVPESFEIGTEKYLKHTVETTPGQKEWTETVTKKAASMREILSKMWKVDEGKNVFAKNEKKDLTSEVKDGTTMTGKKRAAIDTKPTIKEKKK